MNQIPLENWEQSPDDPKQTVYAGQRRAQEVFAEIKHRLESARLLPDEYFSLDRDWENGAEIPKNAVIFSTVQYGGSEGIYLDVSISRYENEKKNITCFATGKTLGESEFHIDRMYLTASAINKALYSNEPHARYITVGGEDKTLEGSVLNLNCAERQLIIDSLIEARNNDPHDINAVEQLLRRVAGSITEYVNEVGARPLRISDYDTAVLAIQDGNMAVFNDVFRKSPDRTDGLLICAAARPGKVGLNMTAAILQEAKDISNESYLSACKSALALGNTEKILMLVDNAEKCVADLDMKLPGEIISDAISNRKIHIARDLIRHCTPEQIQAANPYIIVQAVRSSDYGYQLAYEMAAKNINATHNAADLIHALKYNRNDWMLQRLYDCGMEMYPKNIPAMIACIKVESAEMGKVLIDKGMNFEQFEEFAKNNPDICAINDTFTALKQYWEAANPPEKPKTLENKMKAAKEKVKEQDANKGESKSHKKDERS